MFLGEKEGGGTARLDMLCFAARSICVLCPMMEKSNAGTMYLCGLQFNACEPGVA